jgi:hypothetical protein
MWETLGRGSDSLLTPTNGATTTTTTRGHPATRGHPTTRGHHLRLVAARLPDHVGGST